MAEEQSALEGIEQPDWGIPVYSIQPVEGFPRLYKASRPGYPLKTVRPKTLKEAILGFKEDSITDIFCLLTDGEYFKYYGKDLVGYYRVHGFKVHRFPIPDFGVPRLTFAYKLARAMDDVLREKTKKAVVHCSAGVGRTGLAIGLLAEWVRFRDKRKVNGIQVESFAQRTFLIQFRHHLTQVHPNGKAKGKKS